MPIIRAEEYTWKSKAYMIGTIEELNAYYLYDGNGFILEKPELIELINGLQANLDNYDKLDAESYNKELMEDYKKQMESYKTSSKDVIKKARSKIKGYIYIVTYDHKFYKIGMTKDLKSRLDQLNIKMPSELQLIHSIKTNDTVLTEKLLHERFSDRRAKGEWFSLSKKDLSYIKSGEYTPEIMESIKGVE